MRLPAALRQFLFQSLFWTAVCVVCESFCRFVLHWGYPYNYPATPPQAFFEDFRLYIPQYAHFHTLRFFDKPMPYPAAASILYKLFLIPQPTHIRFAILRYVLLILCASWVLLFLFRRALIHRGLAPRSATLFVLATYLCSYAFWFEVHQANLEWIVWILVTSGLSLFWLGRSRSAAICLGIATAIKFFPVIFLGLFLARKQFRLVGLALATAALFTLASLWILSPSLAYSWHASALAVDLVKQTVILKLQPPFAGLDHSLFGLLKRLLPTLPPPAQVNRLLTAYTVVTALTGVLLFLLRIRKLPLLNQILCLSVAAILFPPLSFDYTLIHLYLPFALFVFLALEQPRSTVPRPPSPATTSTHDRALPLTLALFAFILSAEPEFILHHLRVTGQIKAVALLALFLVGLIHPFRSPLPLPDTAPSPPDLAEPAASLSH